MDEVLYRWRIRHPELGEVEVIGKDEAKLPPRGKLCSLREQVEEWRFFADAGYMALAKQREQAVRDSLRYILRESKNVCAKIYPETRRVELLDKESGRVLKAM